MAALYAQLGRKAVKHHHLGKLDEIAYDAIGRLMCICLSLQRDIADADLQRTLVRVLKNPAMKHWAVKLVSKDVSFYDRRIDGDKLRIVIANRLIECVRNRMPVYIDVFLEKVTVVRSTPIVVHHAPTDHIVHHAFTPPYSLSLSDSEDEGTIVPDPTVIAAVVPDLTAVVTDPTAVVPNPLTPEEEEEQHTQAFIVAMNEAVAKARVTPTPETIMAFEEAIAAAIQHQDDEEKQAFIIAMHEAVSRAHVTPTSETTMAFEEATAAAMQLQDDEEKQVIIIQNAIDDILLQASPAKKNPSPSTSSQNASSESEDSESESEDTVVPAPLEGHLGALFIAHQRNLANETVVSDSESEEEEQVVPPVNVFEAFKDLNDIQVIHLEKDFLDTMTKRPGITDNLRKAIAFHPFDGTKPDDRIDRYQILRTANIIERMTTFTLPMLEVVESFTQDQINDMSSQMVEYLKTTAFYMIGNKNDTSSQTAEYLKTMASYMLGNKDAVSTEVNNEFNKVKSMFSHQNSATKDLMTHAVEFAKMLNTYKHENVNTGIKRIVDAFIVPNSIASLFVKTYDDDAYKFLNEVYSQDMKFKNIDAFLQDVWDVYLHPTAQMPHHVEDPRIALNGLTRIVHILTHTTHSTSIINDLKHQFLALTALGTADFKFFQFTPIVSVYMINHHLDDFFVNKLVANAGIKGDQWGDVNVDFCNFVWHHIPESDAYAVMEEVEEAWYVLRNISSPLYSDQFSKLLANATNPAAFNQLAKDIKAFGRTKMFPYSRSYSYHIVTSIDKFSHADVAFPASQRLVVLRAFGQILAKTTNSTQLKDIVRMWSMYCSFVDQVYVDGKNTKLLTLADEIKKDNSIIGDAVVITNNLSAFTALRFVSNIANFRDDLAAYFEKQDTAAHDLFMNYLSIGVIGTNRNCIELLNVSVFFKEQYATHKTLIDKLLGLSL